MPDREEYIPDSERICVVIPCYRVAPFIEKVIQQLPPWVSKVVAVDDCSLDETVEVLERIDDPRLVVVRHEKNQGVGGAMLTGYRKGIEEGATILVKMDGDDQMPVEHLYSLVQPIVSGRSDYSKANRFVQTGPLQQMPLLRRMGNLGLSFLTKAASGYWNIFDPTNGYTAIDADVLGAIDDSQVHHGYFFESGMLIELNLQRAVVADVDVPARYGEEESSLSILKTLIEFPVHLFRLFLRRVWQRYFVRNFSVASLFLVAGLILMIFGATWGAVFWAISVKAGVPATTGTVMIAVLPIMLGFQLLLQFVVFDVQDIPRQVKARRAESRRLAAVEQLRRR